MEQTHEPVSIHGQNELSNIFVCQRLIKQWVTTPELPSSYVIHNLHQELLNGVLSYEKKGITPNAPGEYRLIDIQVEGEPENFYVRGLDVKPVMGQYTKELDGLLAELPVSPLGHVENIVHNAAWAYYIFERIHPFLDGNGRIGRMIAKRVLKGGGFKDLIFHDERWNGKNRSSHLDAMDRVDKTGDLAYIELYFLNGLRNVYLHDNNTNVLYEIDRDIEKHKNEIEYQKEKKTIGELWHVFKDMDIAGNISEEEFEKA